MRKLLPATLAAMIGLMCGPAVAQDAASLAGTWRGPWYRGMTSGVMTLEITAAGAGSVAFTNLETFGESPAPLAKTGMQGEWLEFSAMGASGRDFTARLKAAADASVLRGAG
ncbi:MAG: hypothetical protein ACREU7_02295, partial [Burkholderiales bacterium]